MVRTLDREHDAFAGGFARLIEASIERQEGRRDRAIAALRRAIERMEATGSFYYCLPARFRLGQLLGGDDGRALMKAATDELEAQGIRDPVRWSEALVPGKWLAPEMIRGT